MPSQAEIDLKITKLETNMTRFDGIVNGDVATLVNTDGGQVPSVANFFNQITGAVGAITGDVTALAAAAAVARDQAVTAADTAAGAATAAGLSETAAETAATTAEAAKVGAEDARDAAQALAFSRIGTSTTSETIGTGPLSFTIEQNKSFVAGMDIRIYNTTAPENFIIGFVEDYDFATGVLQIEGVKTGGAGTFDDWVVIETPAQFLLRGEWDSGSTYYVGNLVYRDDGGTVDLWQALRENTNVIPVEGADWTLFLSGTTLGAGAVADVNVAASAGIGATKLSYLAPYTGAVARTVGDKFAETVSVLDFGAVGDGVADDTAELQAALDTGKDVFVPADVTLLVGSVVVDSQRLYGRGTINALPAHRFGLIMQGTDPVVAGLTFASTNYTGGAEQEGEIKLADGCVRPVIEGCVFNAVDRYTAIRAAGEVSSAEVGTDFPYTAPVRDAEIRNNTFIGNYARFQYLLCVYGLHIHHNKFIGGKFDAIRLREEIDYCLVDSNFFYEVGIQPQPFTVTVASPGVFTSVGHGLSSNDPINLYTTGALPTGLARGTTYYAIPLTADTFRVSAAAGPGSAVNTSGTQSGVHSWRTTDGQTRDALDTAFSGNRLAVTNNIIIRPSMLGIDIKGNDYEQAGVSDAHIIVSGNIVESAKYSGIKVDGSPTPGDFVWSVNITGNKVVDCYKHNEGLSANYSVGGIEVEDYVRYVNVSQNQVYGCHGYGINIDRGTAETDNVHALIMMGNIAYNNAEYGIALDNPVNSVITGNISGNDTTEMVNFAGTDLLPGSVGKQAYGFMITAGDTISDRTLIFKDNQAVNNNTGPVAFLGTNQLSDIFAIYGPNVYVGAGADFSASSTLTRWARGGNRIFWGNGTAPVAGAGTFSVGDIIYNTAPTAGGFIGIVCTTAGSPGTWKTFGPITA